MEFTEITLSDFIQDVMPSTGHNRNQILSMAVRQEEDEKDLLYHNVDDHYRVTFPSIKAYFVDNPRPKRALSAQEENVALKAKVAELEKRLGKGSAKTPPAMSPVTPVAMSPVMPVVTKDEIPPRDEAIPKKKLSETDYAKDLAAELKGVKSPGTKAVVGAKKKVIPKGK